MSVEPTEEMNELVENIASLVREVEAGVQLAGRREGTEAAPILRQTEEGLNERQRLIEQADDGIADFYALAEEIGMDEDTASEILQLKAQVARLKNWREKP